MQFLLVPSDIVTLSAVLLDNRQCSHRKPFIVSLEIINPDFRKVEARSWLLRWQNLKCWYANSSALRGFLVVATDTTKLFSLLAVNTIRSRERVERDGIVVDQMVVSEIQDLDHYADIVHYADSEKRNGKLCSPFLFSSLHFLPFISAISVSSLFHLCHVSLCHGR